MKLEIKRFFPWGMLGLSAMLLIAAGCSKKTVPADNIKILAAVRTAVSIQSQKQIDRCQVTVKTEQEQGRLSAELARELESVFTLGNNGQWRQAETKILKIQQRYKPDPATVNPHSHDHDHH